MKSWHDADTMFVVTVALCPGNQFGYTWDLGEKTPHEQARIFRIFGAHLQRRAFTQRSDGTDVMTRDREPIHPDPHEPWVVATWTHTVSAISLDVEFKPNCPRASAAHLLDMLGSAMIQASYGLVPV